MFNRDIDQALKLFARAISGNYMDKNWMKYQGNRNCGKAVIESINKFTKHNWFIAEQSGWNRIDMTHSNFSSEKEYTKFLLNENQKNAAKESALG